MPVIFSDVSYKTTPLLQFLHHHDSTPHSVVNSENNQNVLINSIDISMSKKLQVKVYDPDFQFAHTEDQQQQQQQPLDPVELKYHRLERNLNNNSLLDRELKPSPQVRDELTKILQKPSNIELTDVEKNLIWRYRYYFSKNNITEEAVTQPGVTAVGTVAASEKNSKFFFTKFLKSINWDNDYETKHVFMDLIPTYWTVDKIQIGDAVELLGNYFNPFTLCSVNTNTANSNADLKDDKSGQVFEYVSFLRKFAVDRLKLAPADELLLYLLQLVQALKYEL